MAQDENKARDQLVAMLGLIARGPHEALGLATEVSAAEVRAAFLQLSKTYHPARFARMPTEIQKLSNEVFLALRGAHDTLAKSAKRQSGPLPVVRQSHSGTTTAVQSHAQRPSGQVAAQRPPATMARTGEYPQLTPPRTKTADVERPTRAPSASPPPQVHKTLQGIARLGVPPAQELRPDLAAALELLARGQWEDARAMLDALVAQAPESPKFRALVAYARGREAQLSQRPDEARIELMTALQIDPDLQLAKTALGELFARRK